MPIREEKESSKDKETENDKVMAKGNSTSRIIQRMRRRAKAKAPNALSKDMKDMVKESGGYGAHL